MERLFTLFLSIATLFSCGNDIESEADVLQVEKFSIIDQPDWFKIDEYIPLNAKNTIDYLYSIEKIRLTEEAVFVLQMQGNGRTVFKFALNGNLMKSINGPSAMDKKFYGVSDIVIQDGMVVLNDRSQAELIYYDLDLNFIEAKKVGLINGLQNVTFVSDDLILGRPIMELSEPSSLCFSYGSGKIDFVFPADFAGIADMPGANMRLMSFDNFFKSSNSGSTLYTDMFCRSLFEVSGDAVAEKYRIEVDDDIFISDEDVDRLKGWDYEDKSDHLMNLKKAKLFDQVFESNKWLIVSFMRVRKRYFIIKDKVNGTLKSGVIDFDYLPESLPDSSPPLRYFKGFTDQGQLVFYHDAEEFKIYGDKLKKAGKKMSAEEVRFLEAADGIDEFCSKVLVFVSLR